MKSMVNFFIKLIEKKKDKTPDEMAILEGYKHPTNYVDILYIEELVNFVKARRQPSL